MVTIDTPLEKRTRELIEELFNSSPEDMCCPYIRKDDIGPYCSKGLHEGAPISERSRMICDVHTLQR